MTALPPFRRRALPAFPGYLKALGPGIVWLALAQGSGELIWWPYIVARYGLAFLYYKIIVDADPCACRASDYKRAQQPPPAVAWVIPHSRRL